MKNASLLLLTCLALPICAEAKTKPKKGSSKVIDMSAPSDAGKGDGLISTELGGREVEFFLKVYEIGHLETWLGEQAKARGEADKVRAVGDALKSTQLEENEMLSKLAQKKGVALAGPKIPTGLRKEVQAKLEKLKGAEFDAAVMEQITLATQQAVDLYNTAAEAPDKDIRYFAQQILPMVKEKLMLAQKVAGKASAGGKPGFRENVPTPPAPQPATPEQSDGEFLKSKQSEAVKPEGKAGQSAGAGVPANTANSPGAANNASSKPPGAVTTLNSQAVPSTPAPSAKAAVPIPTKPTFEGAPPAPSKPAPPTPIMKNGPVNATPLPAR